MWKTLFEEGLGGIIRGDEAFGSMFVRNEYGARHTASLTLLTDYFRRDELAALELPPQRVPPQLEQRADETLATWRDRLYQEFRVPQLLAALTDLKTAYVEVASPLLAAPVLHVVRRLPDDMRTGKRAWRELVSARSPTIPYASAAAVLSLKDFVSDTSMLQLMLAEMESSNAARVFGSNLRRYVASSIRDVLTSEPAPVKRAPARLSLISVLPLRVRRRWVTTLKPVLHPMVLAFRAFIASRMHAQMQADARLLYRNLGRAANL
jgi:hypothetical protein